MNVNVLFPFSMPCMNGKLPSIQARQALQPTHPQIQSTQDKLKKNMEDSHNNSIISRCRVRLDLLFSHNKPTRLAPSDGENLANIYSTTAKGTPISFYPKKRQVRTSSHNTNSPGILSVQRKVRPGTLQTGKGGALLMSQRAALYKKKKIK